MALLLFLRMIFTSFLGMTIVIFPYAKRLEKLRQRLYYLLEQCEEKRVRELLENDLQENNSITEEEKILADQKAKTEYESLKNDIIQMTTFDIYPVVH